MRSRTVVPLVLLLSACAQAPMSTETALSTSPRPALQVQSEPIVAAAAPEAAAPEAAAPERAQAPIAATAPKPAAPPSPSLLPSQSQVAPRPAVPAALNAEAPATARLPKNVWQRINSGYGLPPMENDLVREWENWYSSRPDYVGRMIDRSGHFLYHIVEEVEKRGMPMEVALLPMIESAYNPVAYSRSHASGIWQFIPSTGKDFGLRQNWWYDGRRDVIAATGAALDYLEKLHGMFNDWQLALAAYNWGEGAVSRAMEKNRARGLPTDYESLTVPGETRNYVPKLMAVKNIISNPARYGLQIAEVPNEPYFDTLRVKRHIDMKVAAKMAEMPLDEFKFLNPGHNKPVIKAGAEQRIVLPKDRVIPFLANLEKYDKPLVSWQAVTLRRGEKVEKVAAQHGMTLAELKQLNGLAHQKRVVTGQPLLVPLKAGNDDPQLPDLPATPVTLPKAIQAAKTAAQTRKQVAKGQTGTVQKAAHAGRKGPVKPQRAEGGKRLKVIMTKPPQKRPPQPAQKQKVASR